MLVSLFLEEKNLDWDFSRRMTVRRLSWNRVMNRWLLYRSEPSSRISFRTG